MSDDYLKTARTKPSPDNRNPSGKRRGGIYGTSFALSQSSFGGWWEVEERNFCGGWRAAPHGDGVGNSQSDFGSNRFGETTSLLPRFLFLGS
jgi:hypothetical protein